MAYSHTHKDVCEAIESLQWADMDRMAEELNDMLADESEITRDSLARILHGWAMNQLEYYADEAREKAQSK